MWVFRKRWKNIVPVSWGCTESAEVWQVGYFMPPYEVSDCLQGDGFEVMYEESSRLAAANIVSRLNGGN